MKTYNKEILEASKNISRKTYQAAMDNVYKAMHPAPEILRNGAIVSSCLGLSFMAVGFAGVAAKRLVPALGFLTFGAVVAMLNLPNATRK